MSLNPQKITLEQQQQHANGVFPLVYAASTTGSADAIKDWIEKHADQLVDELEIHGAILFRDFGITDDLGFDSFIRAFHQPSFTYADSLSNAVRRNRTELVFTANEAPPEVSIFLHHEMAQTPVFPSKLFFYCEQAAQIGGATPICRSDTLLVQLKSAVPDFVSACVDKGVCYSQTMPPEDDMQSGQGRSWRSTLSASSQTEAELKLKKLNYQWQWLANDSLQVTTPVLPAVKQLADGRSVFFNQLIAAFRGWQDERNSAEKSICFGDGSTINSADMAVAIDLADKLTFDIPWQAGDVVLLDNFSTMHGRRSFQGQRCVLAALVA